MTASGTTYGNRYTLNERIAVGGMGEVWQATDKVLGRVVAIKLLNPGLAAQSGFAHRFREEARHTAALGHANIATVYDYGEDAGASWLVMELVNGKPLSQIIRDEGAQTPQRTAAILAQAADALQAAHDAGVIHRDVKPANIMVRPDGVVKLTDFGIARAVDAAPLTRTGEVMGTAQYISPEQAMGHPVGPASDLYALGCVAHEMLTGRRPFDDGSAVATAMAHVHKPAPPLPTNVPRPMADVIMACLAKDPNQRPRSARDVAAALRGSPGAAAYASTTVMPPQTPRTEVMTSPTGYAAAAGGAAGLGGAATRYETRTATQPPEEKRRNPAFFLIPLLVLLLALGAWGLTRLLAGDDGPPPPAPSPTTSATSRTTTSSTTTSPTTTSTTPTTVRVNGADYEGLSASRASALLQSLGLTTRIERVDSDEPRDTVLEVNPTGELAEGSAVVLRVSRGPQTPTTSPTSVPSSDTGTTDSGSRSSSSGTDGGRAAAEGSQAAGDGNDRKDRKDKTKDQAAAPVRWA